MTSIELNVRVWLAGLVTGVVLMERWRRHRGRYVPVADLGSDVNAPAASAASTPSADKPSMSTLILSGAKADAERARRSLNMVISRVGSKARLPVPAQSGGD